MSLPARKPLTYLAHQHLLKVLRSGAFAIDATAGNGFDTLFLALACGSDGRIIAFDIQPQALEATTKRLQAAALPKAKATAAPTAIDATAISGQTSAAKATDAAKVKTTATTATTTVATANAAPSIATVCLIGDSHAKIGQHVPLDWRGNVSAITFNLGYLPGGDKAVVTQTASTLAALEACLPLLAADGLLSILCYRGHAEGATEAIAVRQWADSLQMRQSGFACAVIHASPNAPAHAPQLLHVRRVTP